MFALDMEIDFSEIRKDIEDFERQSVTVGVLKQGNASIPKPKKAGFSTLKGTSYPRRKIKSRNKNLKLTALAKILDDRYGFISDAPLVAKNKDLVKLMDEFAKFFSGKLSPRRIENAAIALVRNPIARRNYGKNAQSTEAEKGFNRPMVDTGTIWKSIDAKYDEG